MLRPVEPVTFHSALVPPYVRKTKSLEDALPQCAIVLEGDFEW